MLSKIFDSYKFALTKISVMFSFTGFRDWPFFFALRLYKASGYNALITYIRERNHNHYHVLSVRPPAVLLVWGRNDSILHRRLAKKNLLILYIFYWDLADTIPSVSNSIRKTLSRYPRHRIVCLCNQPGESEQFLAHGVEAIFFNQNALVNENIFNIVDTGTPVVKEWSAVCNSIVSPYKRVELASEIDSLSLISYIYSGSKVKSYVSRVKSLLSNAYWANYASGGWRLLSPSEINELLRKSVCGLCLSEVEGAMFASIEYLLSGIPVVSTPSRGGRDVFFNSVNSIICSPSPSSVASAVNKWRESDVNPHEIRNSALAVVYQHREHLKQFLNSNNIDIQYPWSPLFRYDKHANIAKLLMT